MIRHACVCILLVTLIESIDECKSMFFPAVFVHVERGIGLAVDIVWGVTEVDEASGDLCARGRMETHVNRCKHTSNAVLAMSIRVVHAWHIA